MAETAHRTSLLLLVADGHPADLPPAVSGGVACTPNLDRLARQSLLFPQAYCAQPTAGPARAALLTGRYPHALGCRRHLDPLSPAARCLPELLPQNAYATASMGPWQLGDEVFPQHGFHEWVSTEDTYRAGYHRDRDHTRGSSYRQFLLEHGLEPNTVAPDGFAYFDRGFCAALRPGLDKATFLGLEAARFILAHQDRAFLLVVGLPESRAGGRPPPTAQPPAKPGPRRGPPPLPPAHPAQADPVDAAVGAILDTLDLCNLRQHTLIVFTATHGNGTTGDRLLAGHVLREAVIRVPLLVSLPGQTRAQRLPGPVSHVDLVPALLHAAGATPLPADLHGHGRWLPSPTTAQPCPAPSVAVEWHGRDPSSTAGAATPARPNLARAVIATSGWKYALGPAGTEHVFDLTEDPFEMCDLARQPAAAAHVDALRHALATWQQHTADPADPQPLADPRCNFARIGVANRPASDYK